jgi:hypothetical protein
MKIKIPKKLCFNPDIAAEHGVNAAIFVTHLVTMLRNKVDRNPDEQQWTWNDLNLIAEITDLGVGTIRRVTKKLLGAKIIVTKHRAYNALCYGFVDQVNFLAQRDESKPWWFRKADRKQYGLCAAVLFKMFRFWQPQNKDDQYRKDETGRSWRYESIKYLEKGVYRDVFSYDQIDRALRRLVKAGVLMRRPRVEEGKKLGPGLFEYSLVDAHEKDRAENDDKAGENGAPQNGQTPPQFSQTSPQNDQPTPQNGQSDSSEYGSQLTDVERVERVAEAALIGYPADRGEPA